MPNPIYDEGYRYATQRYDLDGSTIDFEFNFDGGYISEDYVKAFYKNLDLSEEEIDRSLITFVGPNQLRIPDAALQPITRKLVIRRDTPKNLPLVDFTDGSILNERNLDKNTRQSIHDVAELVDFIADILAEWRTLYQDILDLLTTIDTLVETITNLLADWNFTSLEDTPDSYTSQSGKVVVVKEAEDGLEFKSLQEVIDDDGIDIDFPENFTELNDTPSDYTGYAGKIVAVKETEDGLEFVDPSESTPNFIDLLDTPETYTGSEGYKVVVKSDGSGLEFVEDTAPSGGSSQLFIYIDGYFPVSNSNVYRLVCSEAITIKNTGAKANSETATTEEFSLSIYHNSSEVGTIDFATSASEATFDIASDIALAVGDILEIKPTSANNSLSNLAITFIVQK